MHVHTLPQSTQPPSHVGPAYPRCCLQAKENHIPPNVQPSGAAPAGSADAAAAKLSAADKLRRQGNQKFKESQWSEAVVDYSRSIDVLHSLGERAPPEQMALLLGNRAAARMMQVRSGLGCAVAPLRLFCGYVWR